MFKHTKLAVRRFHSSQAHFSSVSHSVRPARSRQHLAAASAVVATSILVYSGFNQVIRNDSEQSYPSGTYKAEKPPSKAANSDDTLNTLVWGSNQSKTLSPAASDSESIRIPTVAKWFDNVALRDLVLHKDYAACVDARGDVYQWGKGFSSQAEPTMTLKGKNIVQLQLTETRVYALSASGTIYTLAADASRQQQETHSLPSSWWGMGWLWGQNSLGAFREISPKTSLSWGEKFVSISAGSDHLLALTSSGRAFAHPVTKHANAYGQLGFRKIDVVPDLTSKESVQVELVPKSIVDPFAKMTPYKRQPSVGATETQEAAMNVGESSPLTSTIYEIPSLQGIKLSSLVAGGRSSFALTSTGRVLGWGANEFGQIGLGNNITLDTIVVPTEVVLWRSVSPGSQTKCLNVSAGGDLTCFTVERSNDIAAASPSSRTIDVLTCGNGQFGGLGNNMYTNAQGTPLRARAVSNLTEYNDAKKGLQPIAPHAVSVSPTGHVLLTLNSSLGRDVFAWGRNYDSELGTSKGKRASVPVPTIMSTPDGERLLLRHKKAKEVKDLRGTVWKRGVKVEQTAVVGYCSSAVFWKVS